MLQAVRHTPYVLASPEPHVVTVDYDERGVIYEVRFFITAFDLREIIKGDVRSAFGTRYIAKATKSRSPVAEWK